jgi:hypothetical protein
VSERESSDRSQERRSESEEDDRTFGFEEIPIEDAYSEPPETGFVGLGGRFSSPENVPYDISELVEGSDELGFDDIDEAIDQAAREFMIETWPGLTEDDFDEDGNIQW